MAAIRALLVLTVITGATYPLVMLGIGEPRVDVLNLNIALDQLRS